MHIIYLDKKMVLENIISEINLINIDESIEYLKRNDGILIKGNINLDCEYLSLGVIKNFKDKVDVSILVPYENVQTSDLQFKLLDFDYLYNNNELSMSFKVNIEGYKEIEKSFQDEIEEMEIVSNVDVSIDQIKDYINSKEEIIELDSSSQILTVPNEGNEENLNENTNQEIEPSSQILTESNEDNEENLNENTNQEIESSSQILTESNEDNEENLNENTNQEIESSSQILTEPNEDNEENLNENTNQEIDEYEEGSRMDFNIFGEEKTKEELPKEETINMKKSVFDSIFKKDKKIKMWKYRVVLENDNYEDIAKEYNVNLYKLKEINQNSLLEIGKIIKIPSYHE